MVRPISNVYVEVNGQSIAVGKVICECDDGQWFRNPNQYITNSEYEEMRKKFEVGDQRIGDMVYHHKGTFVNNVATKPVEKKWIDELSKMGYDVSRLVYTEV